MTLLLRMRNEMSQMQVGKMAAVGDLQEFVAKDVDLDTTNPLLTAAKSGQETQLDDRETSTARSQANVGSNAVCSSIGGDGGTPLPGKSCSAAASDERRCVSGAVQCNHLGESDDSVAKPSRGPSPAIGSVCAATNSVVDAGQVVQSCGALTSADVNSTDPVAGSEQVAVAVMSRTLESSTVVDRTLSTADSTTTLAVVKDILSSVQLTAPGSPHGVNVPSIRTNTVNMVVPAAVAPSVALRTLAPRVIVSTSPANTVLRVQSAATNVTAQPLPTLPSQQLILPVRNQGTAVARVLHSFSVSLTNIIYSNLPFAEFSDACYVA